MRKLGDGSGGFCVIRTVHELTANQVIIINDLI
ncbi:MAG: hypothetical protein K0R71_1804 [Bacillales bacterium]|jgi:hypothetical protein|nr:hypothetical protein [Bacillales bacterium]